MRTLRVIIRGLEEMGPVTLRGQEYGGTYFSTLLATNPELPEDEANRTPRLISELGRLTAAALYEKEQAEARKTAWQASLVHELTNDIDTAENCGFTCASSDPDDREQDAKGSPKPRRCPSKTAAEDYTRTLPEYMTHKERISKATEAWGTLHTALEGALARQWSIKAWEKTGGTATTPRHSHTTQLAETTDDQTDFRHPGHGDASDTRETKEAVAASGSRTPLPAPPPVPPPPPGTAPPPKKKKTPPPPP